MTWIVRKILPPQPFNEIALGLGVSVNHYLVGSRFNGRVKHDATSVFAPNALHIGTKPLSVLPPHQLHELRRCYPLRKLLKVFILEWKEPNAVDY